MINDPFVLEPSRIQEVSDFDFSKPLKLKNLVLRNRVFLAPLAGVSDVPFRRICTEQGAGLTYVEMLSSTALCHKSKRTLDMMARHPSETYLGVQLTGSIPEQVAWAVDFLDRAGFETIDINMGCPVKKVVQAGCGAGILRDPPRLSETVRQARASTSKPLSTKFRLGDTRQTISVCDTVERVLTEHVDMLTIHGRTRSDSYATPCDLHTLNQGLQRARDIQKQTLTVGNGDVFGIHSALRMQKTTGCDAVMISRGALGNPWIFKEILQGSPYVLHFNEWLDVVLRHVQYQEEFFGNTPMAAILLRKHLLWYTKGFVGSKIMRTQFNSVATLDHVRGLLKEYAQAIDPFQIRDTQEEKQQHDPKYEMDRVLDRGVGDDGI